jgi:hypothetical protein
MPVILPEEHHEAWLSNQAGKEILVPSPADAGPWPVSPRVNSPRNNDLSLIELAKEIAMRVAAQEAKTPILLKSKIDLPLLLLSTL